MRIKDAEESKHMMRRFMRTHYGMIVVLVAGLGLTSQARAQDCNGNGVEDATDIADGTSLDCQPNGVPDECEVPGADTLFAADVLYGAGSIPFSVAVGDLDVDGDVKFAPSVALGSLVRLTKSLTLDARRIALIGLDQRVRESVRVTQLHRILEIHNTLEQAVTATTK